MGVARRRRAHGGTGRRPGRPAKHEAPRLTRERVLRAALRQVDRRGVESLSMRRLAADLGVMPSALYTYVRDKSDLLRGIVQIVIDEVAIPASSGAVWQQEILQLCAALRTGLLRHPHIVTARGFREVFPFGFLSFTVELGRRLHEAGFRDRDTVDVLFALFYATIGFVTMEVARSERGVGTRREDFRKYVAEMVAPDMLPRTFEMVPLVVGVDLTVAFERAVLAMLDGFASARQVEPD